MLDPFEVNKDKLFDKKTGRHPLAEAVFSSLKDLRELSKQYQLEKSWLEAYQAQLESLETLLSYCAPESYWTDREKILMDLKPVFLTTGTISLNDSKIKEIIQRNKLVLTGDVPNRKLYWQLLLVWQRLIMKKMVCLANVLPNDEMVNAYAIDY